MSIATISKTVNKVVSAGEYFGIVISVFKQITDFCFSIDRRCRKIQPDNSPYELVPATLNTYSDSITADIVNKENGHLFVLKLEAVKVRKRSSHDNYLN